jgi:outer membrane protein assembly factor BamB
VGDTLYLLGNKFCHVVDLEKGALEKSLAVPVEAKPSAGDVWLYISHEAGSLYCASGPSPGVKVDWNSMFYRGTSHAIFAMDVKSGAVLWSAPATAWTASICVGGGKLFYCDTGFQLHALDCKTGTELWKSPCATYPPHTAIAGGAVFNGRYFLLRVEPGGAKSGKDDENKEASEAKAPETSKESETTPSAVLTSGHNRRKLDAYSAKDGKFLFPCDVGKNSVADVTYSGGIIYAAAEHSNGLSAVDAETGKLKWSQGVPSKCTPTLATPHCILMRSPLVTRVFDLSTQKGADSHMDSVAFAGFRPTCSYPAVPAYGMLMIQAEGCNCSAAIRGNLAMVPGKAGETVTANRLLKGPAFGKQSSTEDPQSWSTWRGDAGRSGKVDRAVPASPRQRWSVHLPGDLTNLAVAHGLVLCGSNTQKLHALDLESGKQKWEFIADGGISVAPFINGDRVYFADDEGYAYCLAADTGQLAWRFRAAPAFDHIVVHEKLASRWPCGSGVVVREHTAYVMAGLFPEQGNTLYALNADSGEVRWEKALTVAANSSVSPAGFVSRGPMALSESKLFLTTGIGAPWSISLDGAHKSSMEEGNSKFPLRKVSEVMVTGDSLFYSAPDLPLVHHASYKKTSTARYLPVVHNGVTYRLNFDSDKRVGIAALKSAEEYYTRPTGIPVLWSAWKTETMTALVKAADTLVSGGTNKIYLTAAPDGKELSSATVNGTVEDLAVYAGKIIVLTDKGELCCFDK